MSAPWAAPTRGQLSLDLSFFGAGSHRATLVSDGVNVDKLPTEYRIQSLTIDPSKPLAVSLAAGGGAVLKIEINR